MTTVLIVIHLMVVVAMVGLVLLQRSEGGALGIGGGSGAFMTGRGAANVLTRSTAGLALAFFATSFVLAILAKHENRPSDIFQNLPGQTAPATAETPTPPTPLPSSAGSAEEMLRELGGSAGPQTPPAEGGGETNAPAANSAPAGGGASPQTPPPAQ
jgi:preprotein translocase subunit SecG